MNLYATDGKCHNAEPGTFGHECGKPATWIGITRTGFQSGFCDDCKQNGREAMMCVSWRAAMSDAQWRLISADQRREILTIAANGDVIVHDKEAVAEHIARLRGWLGIIEETGDPHSITCARNALAGDPVPTRTLNEP